MAHVSLTKWARLKSPWILHFNTGGCNACDIEFLVLLTPRYDIERFGVLLKPSPRQADALIVTGPVTRQIASRLKVIYEQMPSPKFVIAVGACACSGMYANMQCYGALGGVDKFIPVDVYVPGCPPRPEAILYGVIKLLKKMKAVKA